MENNNKVLHLDHSLKCSNFRSALEEQQFRLVAVSNNNVFRETAILSNKFTHCVLEVPLHQVSPGTPLIQN